MEIYTEKPVLQRVNRDNPCPICGKFDWCSVFSDGQRAICMRIPAGSIRKTANDGFLHRLKSGFSSREIQVLPVFRIKGEYSALIRDYQNAINPARLEKLAEKLDLSVQNLIRIGIGWAYTFRAWAFPMMEASGEICGIRLRRDSGRKFAIAGSREGLFIPANLPISELQNSPSFNPLLITEGPTDCAAALEMGFSAIGRPSCTGGINFLIEWFRINRPAHVVIVADADAPGQRGAESLACETLPYVSTLRVIRPPEGIKDVRDWKRAGAGKESILDVIQAAPIRQLKVRTRYSNGQGVAYGR
jgi:hypothetical protein